MTLLQALRGNDQGLFNYDSAQAVCDKYDSWIDLFRLLALCGNNLKSEVDIMLLKKLQALVSPKRLKLSLTSKTTFTETIVNKSGSLQIILEHENGMALAF